MVFKRNLKMFHPETTTTRRNVCCCFLILDTFSMFLIRENERKKNCPFTQINQYDFTSFLAAKCMGACVNVRNAQCIFIK